VLNALLLKKLFFKKVYELNIYVFQFPHSFAPFWPACGCLTVASVGRLLQAWPILISLSHFW
jgi:hypothetical protein